MMSKPPIYLAGIERSGTSLMYALLASHPEIAMTRRTNLWTYFYNQYGDLANPENFERCLDMMMRYKRLRKLDPDQDRIRKDFKHGEANYARLFAIIESHYAEKQGKTRWGDKSLNTERYASEIFSAYPGAKIIHMLRDPRDRYASAAKRWKNMKGKAGAGTAMWLQTTYLAEKNQALYPFQYKIIRYESLVTQTENVLQDACEFIGEAYDPVMLNMQGSPRLLEKGSNSSYGKRAPGVIASDSVARYRSVLPLFDIAFIQSAAKDEMERFGYPLDEIKLSASQKLQYFLLNWPTNTLRMTAWSAKDAILNIKGRSLPARRLLPEPDGF